MINNQELIEYLLQKKELSDDLVKNLLDSLVNEDSNMAQKAALLSLWRAKGETDEEIAHAAYYLLSLVNKFETPFLTSDIVGTGGDGQNTINASTISSIVAASCGLKITKHGSTSVSSKCGSADLLTNLGIDINCSREDSKECLKKTNWCFLFAPLYHPYYQKIKTIRAELKIKTIFNILGPLINPANPAHMVIGVYKPELLNAFAKALIKMDKKRALIVHGSGLDEIAIHSPTKAVLIQDGQSTNFTINPQNLGIATYSLNDVRGGDVEYNKKVIKNIMQALAPKAHIDFIAANTGALLWINNKTSSLKEGVEMAQTAIYEKKALATLNTILEFYNGSR